MCFKNLPIEFDAQGNATLKPGVANPYSYVETPAPTPIEDDPERMRELFARNGAVRRVDFDPVTRVAGALAFHTVVDLENRQVMETASMATLFRGYEIILKGRDPRDAIFISSRACGVCGGVHATASALACEMAFGVKPPPMGVVGRNLLLSTEYLYDHPIHLSLLAGPDFSEGAVRETNPEIWERARNTKTRGAATHGYELMSDLMTDLTPLTGKLYLEGLYYTRLAREAYVLIGGKYPHPQTVVPGGVSTTIDASDLNEIMLRVVKYFDYGRKTAAIWDDLAEFFYDVNPKYRDIGTRPANMIEPGQWDDPYAYDATYANADAWGRERWAPPGVLVDGELRTTSLQMLNAGVEEFVEHAFYEEWTGNGDEYYKHKTDPSGNPLSPWHPWNKETIPKPTATSWKEKYSWSTAPRWDRMAMETGAYSRIWVAAQTGPDAFRRLAVHRVHRPQREDPPSEGRAAQHGDRVEGARDVGRLRAQPRPCLLHPVHRGDRLRQPPARLRPAEEGRAGRAHVDAVRDAEGPSHRRRAVGRGPRLPDPSPRDGQRRARELPDPHALDLDGVAEGPVRQPGPVRGGRAGHAAAGELREARGLQGHRRAPRDPQLRPVHAVHDAHAHGRADRVARDHQLRVRRRRGA